MALNSLPLLRGTAGDDQYNSKMKSSFITSILEAEGKREELRTGISSFAYAQQKQDTAEYRTQLAPMRVPAAPDVRIKPDIKMRGVVSTLKSGFCSDSVIKNPIEARVENGNLIVEETVGGKKQPVNLSLYKEVDAALQMQLVNDVMANDKTPQKVAEYKKAQHKKLDKLPAIKPQYTILIDPKDQKKTKSCLFLFADNDKELEEIKNTLLTQTLKGKDMSESIYKGCGGILVDIVTKRKLALSEQIYRKMDAHLLMKKNELDQKYQSKIIEPTKKKGLSLKDQKSLLRKLSIKQAIAKSLQGATEIEKKKRRALNIFITSLMKANSSNEESMLRAWLMGWNNNTKSLIEDDRARNQSDVYMRAYKYYDIQEGSSGSMNFTQLKIGISEKVRTIDDIGRGDMKNHIDLELLSLPELSDNVSNEYAVTSIEQTINLSSFFHKHLVVYLRDRASPDSQGVIGIGNVKITNKIAGLLSVPIREIDSMGGNEARIKGYLLFVREGDIFTQTHITNPLVSSLLVPQNFGPMKKLHSSLTADLCLYQIDRRDGSGNKYKEIKRYFENEYNKNIAISDFENQFHRSHEWEQFEAQVNGSIKNALKENPNGPALICNAENFKIAYKNYLGEEPQIVDNDDLSFLFYSRHQWPKYPEFNKMKENEKMVIGADQSLYIPIWKSLGKVILIKNYVYGIVSLKFAGVSKEVNMLDAIVGFFPDELAKTPSVERDLIELRKAFNIRDEQYKIMKKVIVGYLGLGILMHQVTNDTTNLDKSKHLLKGFTLKTVGGLVNIIHYLVGLYEATKQNSSRDKRCEAVKEEDVFWITLSIAFVILPEHFISPIETYKFEEATEVYDKYARLGIDIERFKSNGLFKGSSAVGSYKLSILLAQCIYKDEPEVYSKMTDHGFSFLTFCLELTDSMFTTCLNSDILGKLWNLIFFEGSHSLKRRAQQIMLSGIIVLVRRCKQQILESSSSQEMIWHMRARSSFDFNSTQFINDVYQVRKTYFVVEQSDGVLGKIARVFTGDKTFEEEFQQIKAEILEDFKPVALANQKFLNFLIKQNNLMVQRDRLPNMDHLRRFLDFWLVSPNSAKEEANVVRSKQVVLFNPQFRKGTRPIQIAKKPPIESVSLGIVNCDFGDYLPQNIKVEIKSGFGNEIYRTSKGESSWYKYFNFGTKLIQVPHECWIEIRIYGKDRRMKNFSHSELIYLDRAILNRDQYYRLTYNSLWLTYYLRITTTVDPKAPIEVDPITTFDFDRQHRTTLFCEEFADHMKIVRETPYREELARCVIDDPKIIESIIADALWIESVTFDQDFIKDCLNQDLIGKGKPNLFEIMVKFILFSPLDNISIFRLLFNLLTKIDLNRNNYKVKRSHVEFLVWYILRMSLIYMPNIEIIASISHSIHNAESFFESAILLHQDELRPKTIDLTEMFNVWLVATRRRTGNSHVQLGSKGSLQTFEKALNFWQSEHNQTAFKPSKKNKLKFYVNCYGDIKKYEVLFDDKYKMIIEGKERDIQPEVNHIILLSDSEETLTFDQFAAALSKIQILDSVFSRLTGFGGDKNMIQLKEQMQSVVYDMKVLIRHRVIEAIPKEILPKDLQTGECEYVMDIGSTEMIRVLANSPPEDYDINEEGINNIIDNMEGLNYGSQIPQVKNLKVIEPGISIRSLILKSQAALKKLLADDIDRRGFKMSYRKSSLFVLGLDLNKTTVFVQESKLNLAYIDTTLQDIAQSMDYPNNLIITLEYHQMTNIPIYNSYAKDIYNLEGVGCVQNPFIPVQVISKSSSIVEVIFRGDNGSILLTYRNKKNFHR